MDGHRNMKEPSLSLDIHHLLTQNCLDVDHASDQLRVVDKDDERIATADVGRSSLLARIEVIWERMDVNILQRKGIRNGQVWACVPMHRETAWD